ncbi:MAG: hypothetical protein M0Z70_10280 [Nitrospiraceae bacterium]|jgi:anaerobic selenocysteine-containing dehydrogenase|nr:hypothetical protein [Nitrospiraceae bacterium]
MKKLLLLIILLITAIVLPDSNAQAMNGWWDGPYGDYCPMWGSYGARKPVRTANEAKRILQEYFAPHDVKIGKIKEKEWFFEADIKDKNNNLIDVVIVDKRTGRIRSIY